jgi:hypothetical protein
MDKTNTKLEFSVRSSVRTKMYHKVRKLPIFASNCTFLGQTRLKTHIELWGCTNRGPLNMKQMDGIDLNGPDIMKDCLKP